MPTRSRTAPAQVQLGTNRRAMVYGWKIRPGVELDEVTMVALSLETGIGLMGVSVMNRSDMPAKLL